MHGASYLMVPYAVQPLIHLEGLVPERRRPDSTSPNQRASDGELFRFGGDEKMVPCNSQNRTTRPPQWLHPRLHPSVLSDLLSYFLILANDFVIFSRELAKVLGEKGVIVFADVEHVIRKCGRTLTECFQLFDLFHILATDHETISRITKEVIEDFAAEEVVYLELRTTPKNNESKGMSKLSYMKAVIKGLRSVDTFDVSFSNFGEENIPGSPQISSDNFRERKRIYVRLLLSIDRRESSADAMETVCLALEMKEFGVVGIDLSGNPIVGEWNTFLPALKYAKEQGLAVTLHCGEVSNKKEIQEMLDFCPERIGHACFLDEDDWKKARMSKIPVEICLTSNLRTERLSSIDLHHFVNLHKDNHPLALCTDDTGLFSTTLSNEYFLAAATFGLDRKGMLRLAANAVEFVFAGSEVKEALREIFWTAERKLADVFPTWNL